MYCECGRLMLKVDRNFMETGKRYIKYICRPCNKTHKHFLERQDESERLHRGEDQ